MENSNYTQSEIRKLLIDRISYLQKMLENMDNDDTIYTYDDMDKIILYPVSRRANKKIYSALDEIETAITELNSKINSQRFHCGYSNDEGNLIRMLVAPSLSGGKEQARASGLKEIRDFTIDATELIIIDPYMFGGMGTETEKICQEFKKSSRIDGRLLSKIHFVYDATYGNTRSMRAAVKKLASDNKCTISSFNTNKIHDRIWIKNKTEAIILGTSFGGVGGRLSFIIDLPKYDLSSLLDFLNEENMFSNVF